MAILFGKYEDPVDKNSQLGEREMAFNEAADNWVDRMIFLR